jgi:hypothetical protein
MEHTDNEWKVGRLIAAETILSWKKHIFVT